MSKKHRDADIIKPSVDNQVRNAW